jgi:hypothetical protein
MPLPCSWGRAHQRSTLPSLSRAKLASAATSPGRAMLQAVPCRHKDNRRGSHRPGVHCEARLWPQGRTSQGRGLGRAAVALPGVHSSAAPEGFPAVVPVPSGTPGRTSRTPGACNTSGLQADLDAALPQRLCQRVQLPHRRAHPVACRAVPENSSRRRLAEPCSASRVVAGTPGSMGAGERCGRAQRTAPGAHDDRVSGADELLCQRLADACRSCAVSGRRGWRRVCSTGQRRCSTEHQRVSRAPLVLPVMTTLKGGASSVLARFAAGALTLVARATQTSAAGAAVRTCLARCLVQSLFCVRQGWPHSRSHRLLVPAMAACAGLLCAQATDCGTAPMCTSRAHPAT